MIDLTGENILRAIENKEKEELGRKIIDLESKIVILNKSLEKVEQVKKEEKFSHAVQMLILDYMGFCKEITDNNLKAEIYAPLIRRDIETTRQLFSSLNTKRNNKNLNIIHEYFNKAGYLDQVKLVEKDIDRINTKRK